MRKILYSNYDLYDRFDDTKQFIMNEYPELCTVEVEDLEGNITYEPSDDKVYDFIYSDDKIIWDEFYHDIKKFFGDDHVIMTGSVGRWDGTCSGWEIGTFEDLFNDIIKDCNYVEFVDENGRLELSCSHHDGTNSVSFRKLNDKGYQIYDDWEYGYGDSKTVNYSEKQIHNLLMNNFYSKLPHFAEWLWR